MKIVGIPTRIEGSFFVLSFFLGASRGRNLPLLLEWMLVVLVSVLLHELGHALVGRKFGLSPLKHLLISLAGPAAGFLFGGIVFVAGPAVFGSNSSQLLSVAYSDLLWVNLGWGIFNLLPMLPLDGGQVLVTLEEWISKRSSRLVSHMISLIVALGITLLALSLRSIWIAILGGWFVYTNVGALVQ